jgi:O-antigen/teichoic acid export membrane protein
VSVPLSGADRDAGRSPRPEEPASPQRSETAIRGGAIRVLGYLTGVLVSLGSAAVLVRHLGIARFGNYVTVVSLVALVGGVSEAGIAVYGIREFAAREGAERRAMLADLLGMRVALTLIGIAGAAAFAAVAGYRGVLVLGVAVAGVGLLAQVVAEVASIPLQSTLRLGRLAAIDLIRRVLALVLIALLAAAGAGLLPFFAVSVVAGAVALAILLGMVRADFTLRPAFDWSRWRALFAETLPFALAVSVGAIYFYITVVLMSVIASEHQTGLFATSFRVIQVALAVPALVLTAIFPLLARPGIRGKAEVLQGAADLREGDADGHASETDVRAREADARAREADVGAREADARERAADAGEHGAGVGARETELSARVGRVFDVAVIVGIWMSLAMALGASFIVEVLAGSRGHDAAPVLRIQGLVLTAAFVSASAMFGLLALRRYRPMLIVSSCALALDVALGLLLVPALGARGGAVADVITEMAVASALTLTLIRALPRQTLRAAVLGPVAASAALASAAWLLPVGAVARALLASVVYFGLLLLLGAIPEDVLRAGRRLGALRRRL